MQALILTFLILLFACTPESMPLQQESKQTAPFRAFATLSDTNDALEIAASSVYTQLAAFRFRAAGLLRRELIDIETAVWAQKSADQISADLRTALNIKDIEKVNELSGQLAKFRQRLESNQ